MRQATLREIPGARLVMVGGTHTIAGAFSIRAERADPIQGEVVSKVGRTTGWTRGPTTGTCVDVLALGTNHIRLCQAW